MQSFLFLLAGAALATGLAAQGAVSVDYPDSVLNSPQGQYPIYTGTAGNTIRGQIFCPASFVGLPKSSMVCTKVGIQIAGKHPYATFVGRAGISPVAALTNTWATNLPDQRRQWDLSGQQLPGGGSSSAPANKWVEFDLCHPFVWSPGQNLVVDITSKSQVASQYCRTAFGVGVPRMLNTAYNNSPTGTVRASGGIKLRFVFEPLYQPISFGVACPGTNKQAPKLAGQGSTRVGSGGVITINLSKARPGAVAILVGGASCLDLPVFGGCHIYPSLDVLIPGVTNAQGTSGTVIPVPSQASLVGASVTLQYAVDDPNTAAVPLSFSLSNGLRLLMQK